MNGIIAAPTDPRDWADWRAALHQWRTSTRTLLNYDDAYYRRPEFDWVRSSFASCFVSLNDRLFYDPDAARYTLDSWLDRGVERFGGYDSLILWHAYPRIGLDARNQFDFYRDTPSGLNGLRDLSRRCHEHGVRVYVDYNPWDVGTRREAQSDVDALVDLVRAVEADAIFLDTIQVGAAELRRQLDAVRPGVSFEGELLVDLASIDTHNLGWVQWVEDSAVPGVLRNKWFERRLMHHVIMNRWNPDHSDSIQCAWMNGTGMLIWEDVFGSWVGWNERDCSTLRSILPIQRRYADLFSGEGWTPLVETLMPDVYASLWEADGVRLWTLVNRADQPVSGDLLAIDSDAPIFDLTAGTAASVRSDIDRHIVSGELSARGAVAFIGGRELGADFAPFLRSQRQISASRSATSRPITLTTVRQPPPTITPPSFDGMATIPAADFTLEVEFRVRECGFYDVPGYEPLNLMFPTLHTFRRATRPVSLKPYAIDLTPVTNRQFAQFLSASGYQPRQPENFLAHWIDGAPPTDKLDHPVVYVSLNDARAYAQWAGKRLPTEEEWQYAAQGEQALTYPWGDEIRLGVCNSGLTRDTTPMTMFPEGRSSFGLYDLIGNVWQLTESEHDDGRTRFCILKGGSFYRAEGSAWYMDGGIWSNQFAAKMILFWDGVDRCATVGFRCAADLG